MTRSTPAMHSSVRPTGLLPGSLARFIRRLLIPAALGVVAMGLTACGALGSAAALPATTTTTSAEAECASQSLSVSSEPLESAGPSFLVFTLKNTGIASCTMSGVPSLTITDAAGNVVSTPQQTPATSPHSGAPLSSSPVDLASGGAASYWVEFIPCEAPANDDSTAASLSASGVTSGAPLSVPFQATPGCQTLIVSPVVSGVVDPPGFTAGGPAPAPIPPGAESKVQAEKAANPSGANSASARSASARSCAARRGRPAAVGIRVRPRRMRCYAAAKSP